MPDRRGPAMVAAAARANALRAARLRGRQAIRRYARARSNYRTLGRLAGTGQYGYLMQGSILNQLYRNMLAARALLVNARRQYFALRRRR